MAGVNRKQQLQRRTVYLKPTVSQVLSATESLYEDELRPFGRILLKRIRERMVAHRGTGLTEMDIELPDVDMIDPRFLRRLCENCNALQVEPAEGKEYAVALKGKHGVFVDPCSPRDPYPGHLWSEAAAYFDSISGEDAWFPSGRYACAQVLASRGLSFLSGRSLGEICHLVQLAISQKKLLGYAEGRLVPYTRSEECQKERAAVRQQPLPAASVPGEPEVPFAGWEEVCTGLKALLACSVNPGPNMITLSNVKRLFRTHLNLELSETVLGYSRVGDLLQDRRLASFCRLQALGNGQAVIQAVGPCQPSEWHQVSMYSAGASVRVPLTMQGSMPSAHHQMQQALSRGDASRRQPLTMGLSLGTQSVPVTQTHTSPTAQQAGWSSCASNRYPTQQQQQQQQQQQPIPSNIPMGYSMVACPVPASMPGMLPSMSGAMPIPQTPPTAPLPSPEVQDLMYQQLFYAADRLDKPVDDDSLSLVTLQDLDAPLSVTTMPFGNAIAESAERYHKDRFNNELEETRSLQSFNSSALASTASMTASSEALGEEGAAAPSVASPSNFEEVGIVVRNTFLEVSPRRQARLRCSSEPRRPSF